MRLDDYVKLMHEIGIDDQKICVICDDECAFKGTVGALSRFDFRFLLSSAEVEKAEFDGNVMVITVVSKNQGMTVFEFAKGMAEGIGISGHKVLIVHNGEDVFKGTFNDIIIGRRSIPIAESMVLGVSMLYFSSDHEYSTIISI